MKFNEGNYGNVMTGKGSPKGLRTGKANPSEGTSDFGKPSKELGSSQSTQRKKTGALSRASLGVEVAILLRVSQGKMNGTGVESLEKTSIPADKKGFCPGPILGVKNTVRTFIRARRRGGGTSTKRETQRRSGLWGNYRNMKRQLTGPKRIREREEENSRALNVREKNAKYLQVKRTAKKNLARGVFTRAKERIYTSRRPEGNMRTAA